MTLVPTPERLRAARKLSGRSQAECARRLGISRAAYGYREAGQVPMKTEEWEKLRRMLHPGPAPGGVAEELRRIRLARGYSNETCGQVLGMSRESYRLREAGELEITGPELALLAHRLYGLRIGEIFPSYEPSESERLFLKAMLP